MEIQNNYNSFPDRRYQESHTHHITKCLHEEEHAQSKKMAAGMKQDALSLGEVGKEQQDNLFTYEATGGTERKTSDPILKKGLNVIKGIWDSMGDEEKTDAVAKEGVITGNETVKDAGIEAASSAIRQGTFYRIVNKLESARERLKTGISTALKRFNKGDAFSALTDPKGNFRGKKGSRQRGLERAGRGTRQRRPEILSASLSESHLMDSYSKTGEYCQINENLTYHKSKAVEKK